MAKRKQSRLTKKRFLPFSLGALALVFIFATSWDHPHLKPFKEASAEVLPTFSMEKKKIAIQAHAITSKESKLYFGHNLKRHRVQPIHLTIQNNTPEDYAICPSSVDLPRVETSRIVSRVMRGSIPRSIAYKIAGLIFWPFSIPGTIDSIHGLVQQKNLKKEIRSKSMREEIVAAYSTFHRILFVPEHKVQKEFKVTLIALDSLQQTEVLTILDDETLPS